MKFPSLKKFREMIPRGWSDLLEEDINSGYFKSLHGFLREEYSGHNVYPAAEKIFRALSMTTPGSLKAVIIGQDPYHGEGEADGLAFSCSGTGKLPPSLRNIFTEIDPGFKSRPGISGDLSCWARQGVLLLNTILTVREDTPALHKKRGWETFTDSVITKISETGNNIVFMLWGNHAASKKDLINGSKHLVLTSSHPSPFSVNRGFKGCGHFSKANMFLESKRKGVINWECPFTQ